MNITIIGASAGVGLETVKRALQRGHQVTTLSRSDIPLPQNASLTRLKGSATDRDALNASLRQADAVIVALGTGKNTKPTTLYSDFATLLVDVQQEMQKEVPFVVLTGFGAGESGAYNGFLAKLFFRFVLKAVYEDKTKMEDTIARSPLKWVVARPGLLKDGALTERYRVENTLFKGINIGAIRRADVADFLVKQAENPTQLHRYCSLSNK